MTDLEQSRQLTTEIPGPRSIELAKRKTAAVSAGIGTTMPVYCTRAGGGIVEDVDGNRLIDLGSGIAVTTIGNASPLVVDAVRAQVADFTHTCFMVTPYEEYVTVCEHLNRLTPGSARSVRCFSIPVPRPWRTRQDRPLVHEEGGRRRVRSRLPRPHQSDDGADREVDAL